MAPTLLIRPPPINPTTTNNHHHNRAPKPPPRVCFSFAAYAKTVIHHLTTQNVPVEPGLTAPEFDSVESTFHFTFPPDLRCILQEGLPVGPGFPNWRSSSAQQLQILTTLPVLGLCKEVSMHNFWAHSWGEKPELVEEAVELAKRFLKKLPILVPIYRNCYIPCTPNMAGNPVFYIDGGDVRIWSFDLAGFFQRVDFGVKEREVKRRPSLSSPLNVPVWAATEARRIEFWTEIVEGGDARRAKNNQEHQRRTQDTGISTWFSNCAAEYIHPNNQANATRIKSGFTFTSPTGGERVVVGEAGGGTRRRWTGDLVGCREAVWCKLRDGGWKEEEVGEMMDGGDERDENEGMMGLRNVVEHVRELSVILLRAGWSREDVVDSLGCHVENGYGVLESNWIDFRVLPHSNETIHPMLDRIQ